MSLLSAEECKSPLVIGAEIAFYVCEQNLVLFFIESILKNLTYFVSKELFSRIKARKIQESFSFSQEKFTHKSQRSGEIWREIILEFRIQGITMM